MDECPVCGSSVRIEGMRLVIMCGLCSVFWLTVGIWCGINL